MDCAVHYKMNDNAANKIVLDSRGYSNGVAQQNTSIIHTTGKVDGAFTFNGAGDFITTGNTFGTIFKNSFSISIWAKPNDGYSNGEGKVEDDLWGYGYWSWVELWNYNQSGAGLLTFYYTVGVQGTAVSANVFTDGPQDWHHIVITVEQISPTKVVSKLYFDSILRATSPQHNCVMANFNPAPDVHFQVGLTNLGEGGFPAEGRYFDGLLDNFMIFRGALTQADITYLWNAGNGMEDLPISAPIMKYYYDRRKMCAID